MSPHKTIGRVARVTERVRNEYRGHRVKSVSREIFFRAAAHFTPTLEAEWDGKRFLVRTYDRAVGQPTFTVGPTEQATLKAVINLLSTLASVRDVEGLTFLEIGGNIGTTSVMALQDFGFGQLECFEPLPDNHELLVENLRINGLSHRSKVHPVALAESEGEVEFEVSTENSGDGRIRFKDNAAGAYGEQQRQVLKVRTASLDSYVESGDLNLNEVGLAWIDAQGSEGSIFKGACSLLGSDVPILVEFWPYGLRRAGGEAAFTDSVRDNFTTIFDMANPFEPIKLRAEEMEKLFSTYSQASFSEPDGAQISTDLLLINE